MTSKEKDNIISLTSYKHSSLTKLISCLLIFTFIITNVTYGYDRSDIQHLKEIRARECAKGTAKVEATLPNGRKVKGRFTEIAARIVEKFNNYINHSNKFSVIKLPSLPEIYIFESIEGPVSGYCDENKAVFDLSKIKSEEEFTKLCMRVYTKRWSYNLIKWYKDFLTKEQEDETLWRKYIADYTRQGYLREVVDRGYIVDEEIRASRRILDIGTGFGRMAILAKQRNPDAEVIGIDAVNDVLQVAREEATKRGLDIDFRVGDMFALDLEDESINLVYALGIIDYLPMPAQEVLLEEILRVLAPGGILRFSAQAPPTTFEGRPMFTHIVRPLNDWAKLLAKIGFVNSEVRFDDEAGIFVRTEKARSPSGASDKVIAPSDQKDKSDPESTTPGETKVPHLRPPTSVDRPNREATRTTYVAA